MNYFGFITCCCLFLCSACGSGDTAAEKPAKDTQPVTNGTAIVQDSVSRPVSRLGNLPDAVSRVLKGKPVTAESWTDKNGENILVLIEGPEGKHARPVGNNTDEKGNETPFYAWYKELQAVHFVKADTGYRVLWKLSDRQEQCEFDMTAAFIREAFAVTDLDKDGIAETTVQYKLACRSDVSPAAMKLILHEDTVKYALRGLMWIKDAEDAKFTVTAEDVNLSALKGYKGMETDWYKAFGRYENEKAFAGAPPAFLEYARKHWLQFAIERFQ
jgi:hypothetical protein